MPLAEPGMQRTRRRLRVRDVLFLLLVAVGFAFFSAPQMFSPWVYFTGGTFHLMPWWSGVGTFTTPDGEYQLYLYLSPQNTRSTPSRTTQLAGKGHLCTPSGERLELQISGDMDKHLPQDTIGRQVEIDSYVRSKPGTFSAYTPPGSPYVHLNGTWGVGKIEAQGNFKHQEVAPGKAAPQGPVPIAITLHESGTWLTPSCPR